MDYDELAKLIKGMTKIQRKTEVVVFEEGTRRYIWPARLTPGSAPNRPYLEGVAAQGERDEEFFDPETVKGRTSPDVESVKPHPTGLDATVETRPDRVRAPKPTELERSDPRKRGSRKRR